MRFPSAIAAVVVIQTAMPVVYSVKVPHSRRDIVYIQDSPPYNHFLSRDLLKRVVAIKVVALA